MRYRSLDFWRGVACLGVVVHHSALYEHATNDAGLMRAANWGRYGVPIFFVISGYCIAAATQSTVTRGHGVRRYFWRRFRRIFPPYWCALALAVVFVGGIEMLRPGVFTDQAERAVGLHVPYLPAPWYLDGWQWLGNVTLTESWRWHVLGSDKQYFLGQAWTLCYEEQFYAVMGLSLMVWPKRMYLYVVGVTVAVLGVLISGHWENYRGFFFAGLWLQFAAGVLVYRVISGRGEVSEALSNNTRGAVFGRFAIVLLAAAAYQTRRIEYYPAAFLFAIVLILLWRYDDRIARSRLLDPIRRCGLMTYSIYLVHWPICKLVSHELWLAGFRGTWQTVCVTIPLCLGLSIAAGWLFFQAVERHFLTTEQVTEVGAHASNSGAVALEAAQ